MHRERLERVGIMRRHEDDERHLLRADGTDNIEAIEHRHLDVEQHEVGGVGCDGGDGTGAVAAFAGDNDAGVIREQGSQVSPGEGLVVDDECAEHWKDNL